MDLQPVGEMQFECSINADNKWGAAWQIIDLKSKQVLFYVPVRDDMLKCTWRIKFTVHMERVKEPFDAER